jgi:iron complex transport system ATP-binding protein
VIKKVLNKLINQYPLQELATKRAVLSQSSVINFPFTVMEIVLMGRNPYSSENNKFKDVEIAQEALKSVDAYQLKDRIYPTLSGGEQQRVQLARVFAQLWEQKNAYMFLDEPTSALDLKHQHQVLTLIRNLSERLQLTVCIVIHDLSLARFYSDNVILIKNSSDVIMDKSYIALTRKNISNVFDVPINLVRETVMVNEVAAL